jgi:hypothetical protein
VICSAIVLSVFFVLCSAIVLSVFLYFVQPLCCLSFCILFSHCVVCLFVLCSAIVLSGFLYFIQPLCCLSFFYFVQPLCCLSFLYFVQLLCCLSFCTLFCHCVVCLFVLCSAIVLTVFFRMTVFDVNKIDI